MAAAWTTIVTNSIGTAGDMLTDFIAVIAFAMALPIVAWVAMFLRDLVMGQNQ